MSVALCGVGELMSKDAATLPVQEPWRGDDGAGLLVPEGEGPGRWLGVNNADTQARGVGIWTIWSSVIHEKLVNRGVGGKRLGSGGVFGDDVVCRVCGESIACLGCRFSTRKNLRSQFLIRGNGSFGG